MFHTPLSRSRVFDVIPRCISILPGLSIISLLIAFSQFSPIPPPAASPSTTSWCMPALPTLLSAASAPQATVPTTAVTGSTRSRISAPWSASQAGSNILSASDTRHGTRNTSARSVVGRNQVSRGERGWRIRRWVEGWWENWW